MPTDPTCTDAPSVGHQVQFNEGDGEHDRSLGVISRVWTNGRYVTVVSDGRTFVRCIEAVTLCG